MLDREKTASSDVAHQRVFIPLCSDEPPVKDGHLIADELNNQAKPAKFRIAGKEVLKAGAQLIDSSTELVSA